ncbi:MAG TPA: ABC transporter substrate-binding protein [Ilumatobacteraceae bacterium]|nr:ABC transporter substrate-binding protein [Ilumatobacteraceae bacterium]
MRRLLFAVLLLGAVVTVPTAVGATDKKVTFTVGQLEDVDSLNVTVGVLVVDYEVWNLIWPTLTNMSAKDFSPEPGMAESWTSSNGGLTWTYKMRAGMKWSDGEPMTADDVKYTIDRANEEQWSSHTYITQNLTAKIVDASTLEITSSVPDPRLPELGVYIFPKHIYEKISKDDLPNYTAEEKIGGGPFMQGEVKQGEYVRLERNPNWYGKKPVIDEVIIRHYSDSNAQFQALKSGEIDAVDDVPVNSFASIKSGDNIVGINGNQGGFRELAMNSGCSSSPGDGNPALKDKVVRQAINYAIDRDLLVEKTLKGYGKAGTGLVPSADPSWDLKIAADKQYKYDPDKAKSLLDQAGWKDSNGDGVRDKDGKDLKLRLFDRSIGGGQDNTEFIVGWLKDVGIATEVSTMDDDTLTAAIGQNQFDMFLWGWVPFVDPDSQLSDFITSEATTDPEAPGYDDANWCSPEYDKLYDQQHVELDVSKRREIVQKMLELFYEEAPYAVLYKYDELQAFRSDRWENFVRQPDKTGPVLFTNSSPAYLELRPKGGGGSSGGSALLWAGLGVAAVAVVGGGFLMRSRRKVSADERE